MKRGGVSLMKNLIVVLMVMVLSQGAHARQLQGDQKAAEANVPIVNWTSQKTAVTHTFVRPDPAEYMKASNENKRVMRGKIVLDGLTVEFYEQPKDIDFYDSTLEVKRQGEVSRSYNVGELIKHQALSLVHVALIPSSAGSGMLVCEYEGGATGAREGFAILRFSPAGVELHTLPLTDYGKVVVFKSKPERAEIWSSLEDGAGAAAAPKAYATRSCRWSAEGYACGPPKRKPGHFSPTDINDPGIEIRP